MQFAQPTRLGLAGGIATAVRRRAQGVEMEPAGNKIEQAKGHCSASFAVLLQPGALLQVVHQDID